jgi:pyruvate dehydrogenase E1 component alpha subunit
MFDPERYREKSEVEAWKAHDPIQSLRERMSAEGILTDADVEAMEAEIAAVVDDAAAFAQDSPLEDVADLHLFVHTPGSSVLRRGVELEGVAP